VWAVFARWTPPQWHAWRRAILRLFGAAIAPTAGVYPSARIWSPANLVMDEEAFIGPHVIIYSITTITLGRRALISQGAHICAGTHDIDDPKFQVRAYPIQIGERAWVATEAFVGPGVTVGEGAVLGARACTFIDLKPWTVYTGNPARPVQQRALRSDADPQAG
jgi:putative colanic acid biosynthesis acetyltransferase WcaF